MRFLLRLAITAASLWVAVELVPGIEYTGEWPGLVGVAVVFGVVNALIRPILMVLTIPLVVVTFGLFVFVLNALMLMLTGALATALGIEFYVHGFWSALLGALLVGVVSAALNLFVKDHSSR
ncbi:MAG TPA: phage holin family protein [Longimicrobiales bacterium]|nr:phage holin family protein [Longimicrobiales bacterium]